MLGTGQDRHSGDFFSSQSHLWGHTGAHTPCSFILVQAEGEGGAQVHQTQDEGLCWRFVPCETFLELLLPQNRV